MIRVFCAAAVAAVTSIGAPLQADVPARLEAAFLGWAADVGAAQAVLTVFRAGVHQHDVTLNMAAQTPVDLASLSKAITAVCAAHLIEEGVWTAQTTSAAVLGKGPPLSVAGLMTHSAGVGPDRTQDLMAFWLGGDASMAHLATQIALIRPVQRAEAGHYSYNNENYAILGEMIAAETGQPYRTYCDAQVLAPAGVTSAAPSPMTGPFLPYGGWQMSVQDYAAFHWHAFGPDGLIGRAEADWPAVDIGEGAYYGVGMLQRALHGTHAHWHFGSLCFPGRFNIGAYAVILLDDWSLVAAYDVCLDGDQMQALDAALIGAVYP